MQEVYILLSANFFFPLFAGIVMAGILAATIRSSDFCLLIAASAFSKNTYQGILKREASDKEVLRVSRLTLLVIAVIAMLIALDENSIIFTVVSFAWAGFGATFGLSCCSPCSGKGIPKHRKYSSPTVGGL